MRKHARGAPTGACYTLHHAARSLVGALSEIGFAFTTMTLFSAFKADSRNVWLFNKVGQLLEVLDSVLDLLNFL
jgi:hypothetical protein